MDMNDFPIGPPTPLVSQPAQRDAGSAIIDARGLVAQLATPAALLEGRQHVHTAVSESYRRMLGGRDLLGLAFVDALPEVTERGFGELLDHVFRNGEGVSGNGVSVSWDDDGDGVSEAHVVDFDCRPVRETSGAIRGILVQVTDRTRQVLLENDQAFLMAASNLLSSSLDYETTLAAVTRLAVQGIADWCAVDELLPDGTIRRIAVAHPDPEMMKLAASMEERYPSDPDAPHGVPHVLRTGEPQLMAEIPDELLVASAQDEEHLELIRSLGLKSFMVVPLVARGAVLGALTLVASTSGRRFDEQDLRLAEELSHRAGLAIDNARLYRDSEAARYELEEQATELESQTAELQQQAWQMEEIQAELEISNDELTRQVEVALAATQQSEAATALLNAFFSAAPVAVGFLDNELALPPRESGPGGHGRDGRGGDDRQDSA